MIKKKFNPGVPASFDKLSQAQQLYQQGLAFHHKGQITQAKSLYDQALKYYPTHSDALHLSGIIASEQKKYKLASHLIKKAIQINPNNAAAYSNLGNVLKELKQFDAALASYNQAINLDPNVATFYFNQGTVLHELKQYDAAVASYDRAIALNPHYAKAYNFRGTALQALMQLDAAVASYDRAIAISPEFAEAYNNRGIALQAMNQLEAAVASYDQAISVKPEYAEAYNNRGFALQAMSQLEAALASYDRAIVLKPDLVEAYNNLGTTLRERNQLDIALQYWQRAIAIKPDYLEAYQNCGNLFLQLRQFDAAVNIFKRAINISPDYALAYYCLGNAFRGLKKYNDALQNFDKALEISPDYAFLYGLRLHTKMQMCYWDNIDHEVVEIKNKILSNEKAADPFSIHNLHDSLELHKKSAELFAKVRFPVNSSLGKTVKPSSRDKIRIGYFSADFGEHPVAYLTAELFENHDKSRFEIIAFSFGYHVNNEMHQRLTAAFDRFIDINNMTDKEVAKLSRELQIDIAVDLGGYTQDCRTGIFAYRAAPIQVNFLGYLGTMGADYIDYIIADKNIIKPEVQNYYSEKIVYLPWYQPNDSKRKVATINYTRSDFGLPDHGFVYCCFNNSYKINPPVFNCWMRILKSTDDSVLWLLADDNSSVSSNLKKEAALRGVYGERLVFGKRIEVSEYRARYRQADLFIDTLPYNAHTTASDALWVGLPVLTCMGESFASRVAASLLIPLGLPELITTTLDDYEQMAIELATNAEKLAAIKQKLHFNRLTTPLFNTPLYTKHLEAAYIRMFERYQTDLPPDHIYIEDSRHAEPY